MQDREDNMQQGSDAASQDRPADADTRAWHARMAEAHAGTFLGECHAALAADARFALHTCYVRPDGSTEAHLTRTFDSLQLAAEAAGDALLEEIRQYDDDSSDLPTCVQAALREWDDMNEIFVHDLQADDAAQRIGETIARSYMNERIEYRALAITLQRAR